MDYYELLEVSRRASEAVIKAALKVKLLVHHPDRGGDPQICKQLNAAKEILLDPRRRTEYDAGLGGGQPYSDTQQPNNNPMEREPNRRRYNQRNCQHCHQSISAFAVKCPYCNTVQSTIAIDTPAGHCGVCRSDIKPSVDGLCPHCGAPVVRFDGIYLKYFTCKVGYFSAGHPSARFFPDRSWVMSCVNCSLTRKTFERDFERSSYTEGYNGTYSVGKWSLNDIHLSAAYQPPRGDPITIDGVVEQGSVTLNGSQTLYEHSRRVQLKFLSLAQYNNPVTRSQHPDDTTESKQSRIK